MPELPEVENLRRGLEKKIVGQKILRVEVRKPKLVSGKGNIRKTSLKKAQEFEDGLRGERVLNIERRAKNIIFRFASGKVLIVHLKMSGQFAYKGVDKEKIIGGHPILISEETLPNKHTHVIFTLERGVLFYNDTRMFGYLLYYPSVIEFEKANHFELYGLEPLDRKFTSNYLKEALKNKKGKIKSIIMSQDVVTGLGNIYVDESLFEAGILPNRKASSLGNEEIEKLHRAIMRIIKRAVKVGGSSVATYRLLDLSQGNYAREHKVYGKSGLPCPVCATPLEKTLIQTRTTVFCPKCQK